MKIILTATSELLLAAWRTHCSDLQNVELHFGSILETGAGAAVSPANSFGFMDGGIDAVYSAEFPGIQERVRDYIKTLPLRELLVGEAAIFDTNREIPNLIVAPTMRVPMVLGDSINPYLAAKAALSLALDYKLESVAFPGLGTGVGKIPPNICARQMRAAIQEIVLGIERTPPTWKDAVRYHRLLST